MLACQSLEHVIVFEPIVVICIISPVLSLSLSSLSVTSFKSHADHRHPHFMLGGDSGLGKSLSTIYIIAEIFDSDNDHDAIWYHGLSNTFAVLNMR